MLKKNHVLLKTAFLAVMFSCQEPLPSLIENDAFLKGKLKGVWLPVSLSMSYQVGSQPNLRDTTLVLTPTTQPLVIGHRPNPVMAFSDTLHFNTVATAKADTFFLLNRGLKYQSNFSTLTSLNNEGPTSLLRFARPTYTQGKLSRLNYDFTLHGTVSLINGRASYLSSNYTNFSPSFRMLSDTELIIAFTAPSLVNNVPLVPISAQNQDNSAAWGSRSVVFLAKFTKR